MSGVYFLGNFCYFCYNFLVFDLFQVAIFGSSKTLIRNKYGMRVYFFRGLFSGSFFLCMVFWVYGFAMGVWSFGLLIWDLFLGGIVCAFLYTFLFLSSCCWQNGPKVSANMGVYSFRVYFQGHCLVIFYYFPIKMGPKNGPCTMDSLKKRLVSISCFWVIFCLFNIFGALF